MAFVRPAATLSNASFLTLMMQSASPSSRETSNLPSSMPSSQWSIRAPSAMSNRMVAFVVAEQRLRAAFREALEELGCRVWHRGPLPLHRPTR